MKTLLNEADLMSASELAELRASLAKRLLDTPLVAMAARAGDGVGTWLDFIRRRQAAGSKIAEVDYLGTQEHAGFGLPSRLCS